MRQAPPPIIGCSPSIQRARELVERYAPTHLPILLVGPTGTGKELLAEHIHHRSGRRGELVDVNCGALPREMIESLLFGHRRGAFSGAVESTVGLVQWSDGGTLFLDELLSLSDEGQVKLLRVLESGAVRPLGEGAKRVVDLRIVGAVQDDVGARLASGGFRQDLYQRLAGVDIELPSLADRPEDLMPLAAHFAALEGRVLESRIERVLQGYAWPRNVRELRMAIERAGCLVENGTLPAAAVREAIAVGAPRDRVSTPLQASGDAPAAGRGLLAVCGAHGWNIARAAASLGIARSTLYYRLKANGISPRASRKGWLEFQWNSTEF